MFSCSNKELSVLQTCLVSVYSTMWCMALIAFKKLIQTRWRRPFRFLPSRSIFDLTFRLMALALRARTVQATQRSLLADCSTNVSCIANIRMDDLSCLKTVRMDDLPCLETHLHLWPGGECTRNWRLEECATLLILNEIGSEMQSAWFGPPSDLARHVCDVKEIVSPPSAQRPSAAAGFPHLAVRLSEQRDV